MNAGILALVIAGGGIGATARFAVDGLVTARWRSPWGLGVVNTTGSLLLGLLTGLADSSLISAPWLVVLGGGVLGGYTTFSAAMVETVRMLQERTYRRALAGSVGMLVLTIIAAALGLFAGRGI